MFHWIYQTEGTLCKMHYLHRSTEYHLMKKKTIAMTEINRIHVSFQYILRRLVNHNFIYDVYRLNRAVKASRDIVEFDINWSYDGKIQMTPASGRSPGHKWFRRMTFSRSASYHDLKQRLLISMGPLRIYVDDIWVTILTFSFRKLDWK